MSLVKWPHSQLPHVTWCNYMCIRSLLCVWFVHPTGLFGPVNMPTFRWPDTNHDIALAKEVVSSRPTKPLDWDLIASNLNMAFSTEDTQVYLKGRGCKERMERLLNKFKIEDTTSLRRYVNVFMHESVCLHVCVLVYAHVHACVFEECWCVSVKQLLMYYSLRIHSLQHICRRGTEEEYSELMQLLEDISSYMGDLATLQKKVRDSKNKDDKQKAKEIKAVMEKLLVASMLCGAPFVIAVVCMECIVITSWCKVVYT